MSIIYDAKKPGFLLLRWKGTLWQHLFRSPWFYFFIIENLTFTLLRFHGILTKRNAPEVPALCYTLIGALVSFAVVFFLNTVTARLREQVMQMVGLGSGVLNLVTLSTSMFKGKGPTAKERCVEIARYGNAIMHITFYSLAAVDNDSFLIKNRILTPNECEILKTYHGTKTSLISSWLIDVATRAENEKINNNLKILSDVILDIKTKAGLIQYYQRFLIPLGYFHCLTISLHAWLGLLGYSIPFIAESGEGIWITSACYILLVSIYMGLMGVAVAHVDPWGKDASDVDIISEIDSVSRQTKEMLDMAFRPVLCRDEPFGYEYETIAAHHCKRNKVYKMPVVVEFFTRSGGRTERYLENSELAEIIFKRHALHSEFHLDDIADDEDLPMLTSDDLFAH